MSYKDNNIGLENKKETFLNPEGGKFFNPSIDFSLKDKSEKRFKENNLEEKNKNFLKIEKTETKEVVKLKKMFFVFLDEELVFTKKKRNRDIKGLKLAREIEKVRLKGRLIIKKEEKINKETGEKAKEGKYEIVSLKGKNLTRVFRKYEKFSSNNIPVLIKDDIEELEERTEKNF